MNWLRRLTTFWQDRTTQPSPAGPGQLWLERLEDRRLLDAAASFLLGDLLITGDHGRYLDDHVQLDIFLDSQGDEHLRLLDHGSVLAIDIGGSTVDSLRVAQLSGGEIRFLLGSGDDQLFLEIPDASPLSGALQLLVEDGSGTDSVTFQDDGFRTLIGATQLDITAESIQFDAAFLPTLDQVRFDLVGTLELSDTLSLETGDGDFRLTGDIRSSAHAALTIDVGSGDLTINGSSGTVGNELGELTLLAESGKLSISDVQVLGAVALSANEIQLSGSELAGSYVTLSGEILVQSDLTLTGADVLDASDATFRPGTDGVSLTLEQIDTLLLGDLAQNGDFQFENLHVNSVLDATFQELVIDGQLLVTNPLGVTDFTGEIHAGSVQVESGRPTFWDNVTVSDGPLEIAAHGLVTFGQDAGPITINTQGLDFVLASSVVGSEAFRVAPGTQFNSSLPGAEFYVQPLDPTQAMDLGTSGAGLRVSSSLLNATTGFEAVVLGGATQTGNITVTEAVSLDTGLRLLTPGGQIIVAAALGSSGDLVFESGQCTLLRADVAADNVTFLDVVKVGQETGVGSDGVVTVTAGHTVLFTQAVEGEAGNAGALAVDATEIEFAQDIGSATPLAALTVQGPLALGADITTSGEQVYFGEVTLTNDVTLTASDTDADTWGIDVHAMFDGGLNSLTAVGGVQWLAAASGLGTLSADRMLSTVSIQAQNVVVRDEAQLQGTVTTSATQEYGRLLLLSDVILTAQDVAVLGTVDSAVGAQHVLQVQATGDVSFQGEIGTSPGGELGALSITGANSITFEERVLIARDVHLSGDDLNIFDRLSTIAGDITLVVNGTLTTGPQAIEAGIDTPASLSITNTGDLDVGSLLNALIVSPGDNVLLEAGGTLTLPDIGLDVGSGNLTLIGGQDIVDVSGRDLGLLIADHLTVRSGSAGGITTLITQVHTLTVDLTSAPMGTDLVIREADALKVDTITTPQGDITLLVAQTASGDLGLGVLDAGSGAVTLSTLGQGGAIVDCNGVALNIRGNEVFLLASTGIGDGDALELEAVTLETWNTLSGNLEIAEADNLQIHRAQQFGTGAIEIVAGQQLTVLNRGGLRGVSTINGAISLRAQQINIDGLVQTESGVLSLEAGEDLTVSATGLVENEFGATTLLAGNTLTVAGTVQNFAGELLLDGTEAVRISGDVTNTFGGIQIFSSELIEVSETGTVKSRTGAIYGDSGGDFLVAGFIQNRFGSLTLAADEDFHVDLNGLISNEEGVVHIETGSAFLDGTVFNGTGQITIAAQTELTNTGLIRNEGGPVYLYSADGLHLSGRVEALSDNITLVAQGAMQIDGTVEAEQGGIDAVSTASLEISSTGVLTARAIELVASEDLLVAGTLTATRDYLKLTADQNLVIASSGGLHTVAAPVSITTVVGDITLAGRVETASGTVSLNSGDDLVVSGDIVSASGLVQLASAADTFITATGNVSTSAAIEVEAGADIVMSSGARLRSTASNVSLTAEQHIAITGIQAATFVTVTSQAGAIRDGGDATLDIVAPELALQAAQGIGAENPLELRVDSLAALNVVSGSMRVVNSGRETLTIGAVETLTGLTNIGTSGGIEVEQSGNLLIAAPVVDLFGGTVHLTATGDEADLTVDAVVYASLLGGFVELHAGRDLILRDTGETEDIRGQEVFGAAGRHVDFNEFSGVLVRSGTGSVVSPIPRLENMRTPQVANTGISRITVEFGHTGASNFYFLVLWDPAFIDRFDSAPESFEGAPIFGLNRSRLPEGAGPLKLPPVFAAGLEELLRRQAEVNEPISFDGYDPLAISRIGSAGYAGPNTFIAAHFYGANPNKDEPYNPADKIPIAVHIWDDGNITFMEGGQDVGQADAAGLAEVPGDGLQGGVFVFDLSIEVPPLEAPRVVITDAATVTQAEVLQTTDTEEVQTVVETEVVDEDRVLIIERVNPDGTLARLPNGEPLRREFTGNDAEETLSDLPDLFKRLRDGHWRIYLRQGAAGQQQLIRDVELREGKPAGDDAGTQDRPPTGE